MSKDGNWSSTNRLCACSWLLARVTVPRYFVPLIV